MLHIRICEYDSSIQKIEYVLEQEGMRQVGVRGMYICPMTEMGFLVLDKMSHVNPYFAILIYKLQHF